MQTTVTLRKPGSRLGPYKIEALIGAGGMGQVYRASDTRLHRTVAIKILPPDKTADLERKKRFIREARAVSALNHPNIVTLYDIANDKGVDYLVMEYVPGQSLEGRITPKGLLLAEALHIAAQVASALAAAHASGVVHRDIKPANAIVTAESQVKVLDFGLAKMVERGAGAEGTEASHAALTETGAVMGTVAYMSPEQACARPLDHRTDIFSLGVVLYDMLAGHRPFRGNSVAETMNAIINEPPPPLQQQPPELNEILDKALAKDPKDRYQHAGDMALDLRRLQGAWQAKTLPSMTTATSGIAGPSTRKLLIRKPAAFATLAAGVLMAAGIGAGVGRLFWRPAPPPVWTGVRLGGTEIAGTPRPSPDGHTLAFAATVGGIGGPSQVAVMKPETGNLAILTHQEDGWIASLSWSPDGARIYYDRVTDVPRGVFSVPALGGEEQLLLEDAGSPEALADGSLLVMRANAERQPQVFRFWPDSGRLQGYPIACTNTCTMRGFPEAREAIVLGTPLALGTEASPNLYVLSLESGRVRPLAPGWEDGSKLSPGLAVTRDGKTVIAESIAGDGVRFSAIPANGRGPVKTLFTTTSEAWSIDTGPDGSVYLDQIDRPTHLFRFHADGGHAEPVAAVSFPPVLGYLLHTFAMLPDGRIVTPVAAGGHVRLMLAEGGKNLVPLVNTTEETASPVTAAGPGEVAFLIGPEPRRTIATASVANGRITRRIPFDKGAIKSLASSPDGKTLYCAANGTIWAIPVAGGEPKKLHAGESVAVSPDGQVLLVELFETSLVRLVRVPVNGGPEQEIRLTGRLRPAPQSNPGAISKDGRILVPLGTPTWYQPPGLLDPATGRLTAIKTDYITDVHSIGWTPDGQVMALGFDMRSALWKFQPEGQ